MNKLLTTVIILIWVTSVYGGDPGEGAIGQSSWVGRGPEYFLNAFPAPPSDGCPAKKDADKPFKEKYFKISKELKDEVGKRQRALKKWNEQNSKKMMENSVDMPGFQGKSQDEMKKMSKADRKKMAEKMMQDKFGISMDDLKAQKKANKEAKPMDQAEYDRQQEEFSQQYGADPNGVSGKKPKKARDVSANVDFAKTMAGEMQANDLMKSKAEREADKKKMADTGKLLKEQSELSQQLYKSVVGKHLTMLEELQDDEQRKRMLEQVYDKQEQLADLMGQPYQRPKAVDFKKMSEIIQRAAEGGMINMDLGKEMGYGQPEQKKQTTGVWKVSCEALNSAGDDIYIQQLSYCRYTSGKFIGILNRFNMALSGALARYHTLDQVTSDLQKAQTGIGLPDAALGLSGLEAIQQYAALLGQAYANDPGEQRDPNKDAGFCTGAAE